MSTEQAAAALGCAYAPNPPSTSSTCIAAGAAYRFRGIDLEVGGNITSGACSAACC